MILWSLGFPPTPLASLSLCHFSFFWLKDWCSSGSILDPIFCSWFVHPFWWLKLHPYNNGFWICVHSHSQASLLSSWLQYPTTCQPSSLGWATTSQSQHMQNEIHHSPFSLLLPTFLESLFLGSLSWRIVQLWPSQKSDPEKLDQAQNPLFLLLTPITNQLPTPVFLVIFLKTSISFQFYCP